MTHRKTTTTESRDGVRSAEKRRGPDFRRKAGRRQGKSAGESLLWAALLICLRGVHQRFSVSSQTGAHRLEINENHVRRMGSRDGTRRKPGGFPTRQTTSWGATKHYRSEATGNAMIRRKPGGFPTRQTTRWRAAKHYRSEATGNAMKRRFRGRRPPT